MVKIKDLNCWLAHTTATPVRVHAAVVGAA